MEKLDLEAIRRRIDKIDAQLVAALEERMEAVLEVAAYKKQQGLPVLDAAREAQVLSKACMRLQHKEYAPAVTAMMTTIMEPVSYTHLRGPEYAEFRAFEGAWQDK